jgi:hypothetical protein
MPSKSQVKRVTAQSKAVVPAKSRAIVPGGWREQAAKSIDASKTALAKLPQASGNFISFRGGAITLAGNTLQNPLPIVLLAHGYERSFYSKPFQPDVAASPDCYSYDGETPHPDAKVPQSDNCSQCRYNQFGSAQNGKGKGCKEGARLAFIMADALEGADRVAGAVILQGRLSVLNSKNFRSYAGFFAESGAPTWSSVTLLRNEPDSKSQYLTTFVNEVVELDDDIMDAIAARVAEAEKLLVQPYPELEAAKPQVPVRTAGKRKF